MKDQKFWEIIAPIKTVLILASKPLDFDCIGSGLILKKYLESLSKRVTLMFPYKLNLKEKETFNFLPYFNEIIDQDTKEILSKKNFDVLIFLDGTSLVQYYDDNHVGNVPDISIYDKRIRIDHHQNDPENLGTYTLRDGTASSTAEVILNKVIPEEFIDKEVATLSYAAIVGDTGNFQWNFSPQTLQLASLLFSKGANVYEIINRIFFSSSRERLEMLAFAINNIEYYSDIATLFLFLPFEKIQKESLDKSRLKELERTFKDDLAKKVAGFDRGIMMFEETKGKISIKVRCNNLHNKIDMPKLLLELGGNGGGHFNACGADIEGDFERIKKKLIDLIGKYLKEGTEVMPKIQLFTS